MGNLKEIRNRIASVNSTQKITSAMKLVSAAKLRRAQTAIISFRPYSNKLNELLSHLADAISGDTSFPLLENRQPEKVMIVAITSNRGLCGSFNANVIKEVHRLVQEKYQQQANEQQLQLICIGKKAYDFLAKTYPVTEHYETLLDKPDFGEVAEIADRIMNDFFIKKIDRVEIVYNQFVNPATQKLTVAQFLPVQNLVSSTQETTTKTDYLFEPSKEELLTTLIPKILKTQLYKTLIDSIASEHGARMTSMAKATDNATEMLKMLKLKYNNARQSSITNELLEIISGANALDN